MPAKKAEAPTRALDAAPGAAKSAPPRRKAETVSSTAATSSRQAPRSAPRKPSGSSTRRGSTSNRRQTGPHMSLAIPQTLQREIIAVLVCLGAILTAISLAGTRDSGLLGAWGDMLNHVFGWAAWLVPVAIAATGIMLFIAGMLRIDRLRWETPLGIALILAAVVGLIHLPAPDKLAAAEQGLGGGWVGYYVSSLFEGLAGGLGTTVILLTLVIIGMIMAFHLSLGDLFGLLGRGGNRLLHFFTASDEAPVIMQEGVAAVKPRRPRVSAEEDGLPPDVRINPKGRVDNHAPTTPLPALLAEPVPAPRILGMNPTPPVAEKPAASDKSGKKNKADGLTGDGLRAGAEVARQLSLPVAGPSGMLWKLPEITLLDRATEVEINDADLMLKARKIEETLATFSVEARVREINSGPAVTQFALEPGEGVRVARIASLANDLALALAAPSIRIEAPVPGMSRVGIEVPNVTPALVGLRNILETDLYRASRAKLRYPIGRDTHGNPVVTDLAKLPHLLIAGATGSGKSVAINSLIVSFLMQYTPDELRMLMIDPKRVELSGFNGVPHLLRPVVTEMKHEKEPSRKGPRELTAIEVLKWLLWEMERRYKIFAKGTKGPDGISRIHRNIEQYHTAARSNPAMEPMPYIILIIDELADLMLVSPEDVETALCRLAQLARATGIHLIIATQRPSVDVVTGLIKANFPARIAFAVTSMIDSRVILDTPGAEKLLGRGDALYTASDESKPIRVQGTFVADKETERVIQFWRAQLPAPADGPAPAGQVDGAHVGGVALAGQQVQVGANVPMPDWLVEAQTTGDGEDDDTMLKEAVALVKKHRYASTSMLQRRLRIGYNRAARLIEEMEAQGIVGPADGSRSREVLVKDADADGGEETSS
jgi:S-DNA-T family DNA segregation ATPase FtsK/SpoIIIE